MRFERQLAQSSWTKASMASLWTSLYPARSGITRFDWHDGRSRIMVTFEDKGATKATAAVSHERLADAAEAEAAKAYWRRQLSALKAHLEADR